MSNPRQPKWDWSVHLPKMLNLYNQQVSIPDIHKAIQCQGFEPCQRSVYLKFKSMGYPTDPVGRTRLIDASFPLYTGLQPDGSEVGSNGWAGNSNMDFSTEYFATGLDPVPEDQMIEESSSLWGHAGFPTALWPLSHCSANSHTIAPPETQLHIGQYENLSMELNGAEYFGINTESSDSRVPLSEAFPPSIPDQTSSWRPKNSISGSHNQSEFPSVGSYSKLCLPNESFESLHRKGTHTSSSISNNINNSNTRNKLRSLFRPKSSGSGSSRSNKRYTDSQFTVETNDSGYASGHASCLTLDQVRQIHSQSLREFNGLYRVACHVLHEPQGKSQCKDIPSCFYCQYSGCHNLGWSARYLKLEVFLSELILEGVYNFEAIDAAGNTALHYAAAGGASFQHLKALMDTGVDPYLANTAGELFIYCLRPLQPFTLEPNSDCLNGDDLVKLLELLQPSRILNWRDNDGRTVMHALSLKIKDSALKIRILKMFVNAGYSPTTPDRFGKTAHDIIPLIYDCHGQVINSHGHFSQEYRDIRGKNERGEVMTCERSHLEEWSLKRVKQVQAQSTIVEAHRRSSYIHPETGDNAVHALSQLQSNNDILLNMLNYDFRDIDLRLQNRAGNNILLNLEYFVPKIVDINLPNREGSHPLRSFICNRPGEENETGATMSKYLDAILWKDTRDRTANAIRINMKDREGATALHHAAIRGRPDSVRSLIDAGANVNARSDSGTSILRATFDALDCAMKQSENVLAHLITEVVSHLEHAGAVLDPSSLQERGSGGV